MCCRYYKDRFILLPKFLEWVKGEDDEKVVDRHAALAARRVERTRAMEQKDNQF